MGNNILEGHAACHPDGGDCVFLQNIGSYIPDWIVS
jgi:hypothetical protein